jgi:hypothetical protein
MLVLDHPASLGDSITASYSDEIFGTHNPDEWDNYPVARDDRRRLDAFSGEF